MSDVDDLVTWLRATIGEIKDAALSVQTRPISLDERRRLADPVLQQVNALTQKLLDESHAERLATEPDAVLLEQLAEPHVVLAQCEAHEMVLTLAETVYVGYAAVRALGLAYQHRPGYREEWKP